MQAGWKDQRDGAAEDYECQCEGDFEAAAKKHLEGEDAACARLGSRVSVPAQSDLRR
jgi:hypothetical protein